MIRLYHTSNVEVRIPDLRHSREHLDFGRGFYLTSLREQAEKYGQRFLRKGETAWQVSPFYGIHQTLTYGSQ